MSAAAVDLLLVAGPLAESPLASLFRAREMAVVPLADLRVATPWRGRLFDLLGGRRGVVGLLVPVRWLAAAPAPVLVAVTDHVNVGLRGPQPFPVTAGIYQPALVSAAAGHRVYSESAVAGIADAAALTPFEQRAVAASGCLSASDCLVDAALVAAAYGLGVAACGVPIPPPTDAT